MSRVSVLFNEPKLLKSASAPTAATRRRVSVLFNEPKLLKFARSISGLRDNARHRFSALQRAEIAEICVGDARAARYLRAVSVLFNEPKLLKCARDVATPPRVMSVSVLFNEPKLLKCDSVIERTIRTLSCFSALQRAEIAEMLRKLLLQRSGSVSVLFNEPKLLKS
jgi:hypothetical protein